MFPSLLLLNFFGFASSLQCYQNVDHTNRNESTLCDENEACIIEEELVDASDMLKHLFFFNETEIVLKKKRRFNQTCSNMTTANRETVVCDRFYDRNTTVIRCECFTDLCNSVALIKHFKKELPLPTFFMIAGLVALTIFSLMCICYCTCQKSSLQIVPQSELERQARIDRWTAAVWSNVCASDAHMAETDSPPSIAQHVFVRFRPFIPFFVFLILKIPYSEKEVLFLTAQNPSNQFNYDEFNRDVVPYIDLQLVQNSTLANITENYTSSVITGCNSKIDRENFDSLMKSQSSMYYNTMRDAFRARDKRRPQAVWNAVRRRQFGIEKEINKICNDTALQDRIKTRWKQTLKTNTYLVSPKCLQWIDTDYSVKRFFVFINEMYVNGNPQVTTHCWGWTPAQDREDRVEVLFCIICVLCFCGWAKFSKEGCR
ncbi:hypothetical protein QR680_006522 [Steinernema hermaphroditum]|uniref:Protein sleepless n=1 Tax=Steinernema hermaphroditum TaxID=289476 RepID=A0AA39LXK0_9BILA|nr:hypothetical protein QR680_006522 [Steinernema hermaphroditum]